MMQRVSVSMPRKIKRVRLINSGGTIIMARNDKGNLEPMTDGLTKRLSCYPACHDESYPEPKSSLVLPLMDGKRDRVLYDIFDCNPLLDSSCTKQEEWLLLSKYVFKDYEKYDGFVILHGTDTMAYTCAALSFLLENLGKPVVVTGAQIPIFEARTDGLDNLITSVQLAAHYSIPEVLLYFGNKVMRGVSLTKVSSESFQTFDSFNQPVLGTVGVNIRINCGQIRRPSGSQEFTVAEKLEDKVALVRIYPGIKPKNLSGMIEDMKGVVIESYGAGNIPNNVRELKNVIIQAVAGGMVIINITQCLNGGVSPVYETGAWMMEANNAARSPDGTVAGGVVAGGDMTQEAAFSKLAYVLAKPWDMPKKLKFLEENQRGELTEPKQYFN